jgi:hypothetical protein
MPFEVERKAIPNSEALTNMVRYSGVIEGNLSRAYRRLVELQERRKGEFVPPSVNLNLNA